ncbi:hypothetical protein K492DRAFT_203446 [Lichtheimia hyalospora FSU 10163]|nr:hypothetical protein K492DRAFT_203446 [Lichtheimia hyalospora FSU 10163]
MSDALAQTLDQLQHRLSKAQAQLRRAKKIAEAKRAVLLDSQDVLSRELKDAFTMETLPKRKRPRIAPPPGLVSLLPESIPSSFINDNDDQSQLNTCQPIIQSCSLWAHENGDIVWIRATVENPSSVTLYRFHLALSTGTQCLLPQIIHRNTILSIPGYKSAVLYASFTMLDDVFLHQLTDCLNVSCQYISKNNEWHSSDPVQPLWETMNSTRPTWIKPGVERELHILFKSRASMLVKDDPVVLEEIIEHLNLQRDTETSLLYTQDQQLVIHPIESTLIHVYSVTDRILAKTIDKLKRSSMVANVKYNPPLPVEHDARDLLVALQDEIGYMESIGSEEQDKSHQLLAARENTLTLFNTILQTRSSPFL